MMKSQIQGKSRTKGKFIFNTILVILAVVWVVPFFWLIRSALMDLGQIFSYPPVIVPNPIRWSNFKEAMTVLPFGRYIINTLTIVVLSVSGIIVSCSLSAYGLTRIQWKYRDVVFTILMSTIILPYFTTLIPNFILWKSLGLTDSYLPMTVPAWFSIGTASIYGGGMFNIFLLRQFFRTIPKEIDEAANVDGAGHMKVLLTILLPLSKPALICIGLFTFLNTWNDLINPLIYLNNEKKYTIQLGLRTFIGMYTAQWNLMMAAAVIVIIPVLIVFFIGQKYFVEGIVTTGIKG
jgi:multiple sugar transport system permease protein